MKKTVKKFLIVAIFILMIFNFISINNSYCFEQVKAYNLKINLKNISTTKYTIELLNGEDKVYISQNGNDSKEHEFVITGSAEKTNLEDFKVRIKYKNGKTKTFDNIKLTDLVKNENDDSEIKENYIYNLKVNIISLPALIGIIVVVILIGILIYFKTHKRVIK